MIGRRLAELGSRSSYALPPAVVVITLFIANALYQSQFLARDNWATTMGVATPYILTAMAQALPLLSGNGGLDLSIGPFVSFVTVVIAAYLAPWGLGSPWLLIPIVLVGGFVAGSVNGVLIAVLRLPPIIATLGTYLFYAGASATILLTPGGDVPHWLVAANGSYLGIPALWIPLALVAVAWIALSRTSYVRNLLAVGGDVRTAYTAGVDVVRVRVLAYGFGGMLGAVAGMLYTGLLQAGDATQGQTFTVASLTAVALGGIALAGGRGGMLGAALGGLVLYLIQNLLTVAQVSVFELDIANGAILIAALALNGGLDGLRKRRIHQVGAGVGPLEPAISHEQPAQAT
jgi:ribose transport system permease protein